MNTALLTFNDDSYNVLADLTLPTKRKYCDKWGLTLEYHNSNGRDPSWYKPDIFLQTLNKYDAVLFIECDAAIINQDFDVRPFLESHEFVIAADVNGINAGVFMGQSTDLVKQFFYTVITQGPTYWHDHPWRDQEAMKYFGSEPPYDKMITYVEQNFMNSYLNDIYGFPSYMQGNYQPGDWIVHLPGKSLQERCQIFKERFNLVKE
jgi:hypothetical protein